MPLSKWAAKHSTAPRLKRSKGPDPMPPASKGLVENFEACVRAWSSAAYRARAVAFMDDVGAAALFRVLHAMRRWYSGATMAGDLKGARDVLAKVMDLEPGDARGVFRGFRVAKDDRLASSEVGAVVRLPVERNGGVSSWSTSRKAVDAFSGAGRGRVGIVVQLASAEGVRPLIAPPERTAPWTNSLYEFAIGKAYRQTEGEYLLEGRRVSVKIVAAKR